MSYTQAARPGILAWLDSIRATGEGWGRWPYHARMEVPWALQASAIAIGVLRDLGALEAVSPTDRAHAIRNFQACQDPADGLFKDPLETPDRRQGTHSWEQIWGQRHGATLQALDILAAEPLRPLPPAQFGDPAPDPVGWTRSIDWRNPWGHGESWARSIQAFLRRPGVTSAERQRVLDACFATFEAEVLDPDRGFPMRGGCDDPARGMAGCFKTAMAYLSAGRPWPHPERAIDATLALQRPDGEFGYPRNMCMNWDALWVLRVMDRQLGGAYRHADTVRSANRCCGLLMDVYRKPDGAFAFHGEHCQTNHHSIRLCERQHPISDMLGTMMCLQCLLYADEFNGQS